MSIIVAYFVSLALLLAFFLMIYIPLLRIELV